ncbi:DEKNAAC103886 [Brettanomyces naardenensis]|uniref:DEKNAAC103886 n=1 Tax=Brettanomyces naardenensis TaxID=13370 RepID=A0A448YPJ4_BRENA|nr:DEKNAAC103886 [Brettanomyces naardenensis]
MTGVNEIEAIGVHDFDHWIKHKKLTYKLKAMTQYYAAVKIIACGICFSDIHAASGAASRLYHPITVGHEIVGRIVAMSSAAGPKFIFGYRLGIGPQSDSCGQCSRCTDHTENNCEKILTYGTP